jgi:predicted peroxiredoxin
MTTPPGDPAPAPATGLPDAAGAGAGAKSLAIMVWSCDIRNPQRAATPFMVAQAAAALDLHVEMLFTAEAIGWLLPENGALPIGFGPQARRVREYLETCAELGITIHACSQAMAAAEIRRDMLVPQCGGFAGMVSFVDHCHDAGWRTLVF